MACGAAVWSLATFLTPWAANHSTAMLLAVRALFGLAEGVAFPSMSTLLFRWFPGSERASAVGISMAGFHLGNVISFLASPIILSSIGINEAFAFFAALGFIWLSAWTLAITNDPRDSPRISQAELQLIRAGKMDLKMENSQLPPLRYLLSKPPAWSCILANVANNWGYFVLLSWMPVYFKTVCIGIPFSGSVYMRTLLQNTQDFYMGYKHLAPSNCLSTGITNSAGTLAAIISTIGTGYFVQWLGSFQAFLTVTAALYFGTTLFYNLHATADQVFF
ncbi:hypothetical protein BHE74_00042777 [Ensete ventricosum]|uniref:Major facilitator superfamily (MFS) profile domain-containing protein n=1 Tax=Ensete ventricosum TaxID=4639 RepID=A0A426XIG4_ENSVE|nr:hypothetical protein B296_00037228 [Ensete ventricosum]RWW50939.1 hypothetical protein BHE74_00042777 [Ensete ventricosum]